MQGLMVRATDACRHAIPSVRAVRERLARWFKIMLQTEFRNFSELRATFPTADKVGDWIVFNIGGNKYRLIASIHFNRGKVYIRHVLTHPEYDKGAWKL